MIEKIIEVVNGVFRSIWAIKIAFIPKIVSMDKYSYRLKYEL